MLSRLCLFLLQGSLILSCTDQRQGLSGGSGATRSDDNSPSNSGGSNSDAGEGGASTTGPGPTAGGATAGGSLPGLGGGGGEAPSLSGRLVAIGDLHSDISSTRAAFQLAGAIDDSDTWVGDSLTIVQLGDVIGRSDDEREVLEFIFSIREKAMAAGGRVHILVGNHEIMGGRVDNQAVGANPFAAYVGIPDLALEDPRLQKLPIAHRSRGAALMTGGPYAKRIADFPTVLQIGDTVYVHGGVVPRWASYGIEKINSEVSEWLRGNTAETEVSLGVDDRDTVMWTRQFSSNVDENDCTLLSESLAILGAKRMIVAHTVQDTITPLCDERLWALDVGMSRAYGGPIEVLEIVNDSQLTVLRR